MYAIINSTKNEQNVAVQLLTGVVKHAKSDHLGRKVFDELQLGKGLMNRSFSYHKGGISEAHENEYKKQVLFANQCKWNLLFYFF